MSTGPGSPGGAVTDPEGAPGHNGWDDPAAKAGHIDGIDEMQTSASTCMSVLGEQAFPVVD